jgi:hypothetical protein
MAINLEQLQKATLDDLKRDPNLLREAVTAYGGFKDGVPQYNGQVGDMWLSGQRDFNYDKQYALQNLAGSDRSNPVTQQFYGDGALAAKDAQAFYAPETLVAPQRASFVSDASYNEALRKFQTTSNWATPISAPNAPLGSAQRTQDLIAQARSLLPPQQTSLGSPFNASSLGSGTASGPTLPKPTGPTATLAYTTGLTADFAAKRTAVESAYKTQVTTLESEIKKSNDRINELTTLQENGIKNDIQAQLQPFRESLEKSERERLKVEENYFANQKLVGELDSLLTTLQSEVKAEQEVTGLSSIRSPRVAKIKDEVAGRVGVIEAVMSARSGQIAEAYRLIDRSVDAIAADRNDRLTYYQTLQNFYEGQKDTEGKKLLALEGDKKTFLNAQISLIENDLKESQATANYIKELMVDPKTALTVAQAGITLNDSIATINAKLAKQGAVEEKSALINDMAAKGYSYAATPGQLVGKTADQIFTVRDSQGKEMKFIKSTTTDKSTDGSLTDAQIQTTISGIVNQFDAEPLVKDYNVIASGYQFAQTLANQTNPTSADDQGLLYAFAKAMDPNSVVREGEYATVQKYAQSAIQRGWANAKRFASNEAFLSTDARANMLATINSKFQAADQAYQNVYSEYNRRIEDAKTGQITGSLTNYGAAFGSPSGGSSSVSFDSWASF